MNQRTAVIVLAAALILPQSTTTQAQATNPPYLSQFPSVERVKSEIKGADGMNTAARQMGAFWQLRQMIVKLAGPRFYRSPTPDENQLIGQYNQAYHAISQPYASYPDRPKWYQMHGLYETDDGFLDQLLQKFFSPEFRTAYYTATGKQPSTQRKSAQPSVAAGSQLSASRVTEADLLLATGFQWEKAKNYKVAISAYKDAIALQPNSKTAALAQKQIGMIYNTLERYQDAVLPFRESLRIDPNQHIASKELGFAYYMLDRYPEAFAGFEQAIRLKPDYGEAHYILGLTYVRMGKKEEALQVYQRLLTLDKQDAQKLYAKINEGPSSQPVAKSGSTPSQPTAGTQPRPRPRRGEPVQAAPGSRSMPSQPSTSVGGSAKGYLAEGKKYFFAKDFAKAVEPLKKAIALDASMELAHYWLSNSYGILGQYQDALPPAKEAVRLAPKDWANHFTLGLAYSNLKQYKNALPSLQEAIRLKPDFPESHYWLGRVYSDGYQRYDSAISAFREALRLDPNAAYAYRDLGAVYYLLEQYPQALEATQQALRLKPNHALAHLNLGRILLRMGRKDDAVQVYRKLLTLDKQKAQEFYAEINKPK